MKMLATTLAAILLFGPVGAADTNDGKDKASPKIVVTLHFTSETKVTEVLKLADNFKSFKEVELLFRAPEEGKGIYAEVSAFEAVPAKDVGAVVEELWRNGVRKITIEVKK